MDYKLFIIYLFFVSLVTMPSISSSHSLVDILNATCSDTDVENFNFLGSSDYHDDDEFIYTLKSYPNRFTILGTNIQSLYAKYDELILLLDQYNSSGPGINVICIQETWLGKSDGRSHIDIPGYNCASKFYTSTSHGGLATYIRDDLEFDANLDLPYFSENIWESIFVKIWGPTTGGRKLIIGNVYRPPKERVELLDKFLFEFNNMIESFHQNPHVHVAGDYNLDMFKSTENFRINQFLNQCFASSYFPKIFQPTRIEMRIDGSYSATLIDNFLCKSLSFHELHSGILTHKLSDHQPYFMTIDLPTYTKPDTPIYRHTTVMTKESKQQFKSDLGENLTMDKFVKPEHPTAAEADSNFSVLHEVVTGAHTKNSKKKKVHVDRRTTPKSLWITPGIIKSIRYRNKLYKKLKKLFDDVASEKYLVLKEQLKNFKKVLRKSIKLAKKKFLSKAFEDNKNDPRKTWNLINSLTGNNTSKNAISEEFIVDGESITNKSDIANGLNNFFTGIASKLTSEMDIPDVSFESYLGQPPATQFTFHTVDKDTVGKAIDNLKCKPTRDCDGLSTELLKLCKFELLEPINLIINQCITSGTFPDQLKIARVSAIFKKGNKKIFDNYRPISILPAISKIFERILHDQISTYFTENKLFYTHQYGFRKNHSTEFAALELVDRVMLNLENRDRHLSIFMDLSKAFDCINHDTLILKLEHYGMTPVSIALIKNYLSNRQQFVQIENFKSNLGHIGIGVPQGSILGPLLFLIYINDIASCTDILSAILYADDSTFSACIDDLKTESNVATSTLINQELDKVNTWLLANKLCLNAKKTQYMTFNRTEKETELELSINNTTLENVNEFNFLGLMINNKMDWNSHINMISSKINRNIGIIRRLRHLVPPHTLTTLYYTLVHPHLTYMLLAWGYDSSTIETEQKKALRLIHNKHHLAHTEPLLRKSNILKLPDMHTQAQLKFCYKYVHGDLPDYFQSLPTTKGNDQHDHYTRDNDNLRNAKPSTETGRKLLRNSIPKLVNSLPANLADGMYSAPSFRAYGNMYKRNQIATYSDIERCKDNTCYPCSAVYKNVS